MQRIPVADLRFVELCLKWTLGEPCSEFGTSSSGKVYMPDVFLSVSMFWFVVGSSASAVTGLCS